jgi:cell division transport system permease protein
MWTRISYFSRETLVSLRRNVLMTVAGIATVAVSLALFGGILMLSKWVDHGTEKIKGGVTLEIFMNTNPNATQRQVDAVRNQLDAAKGPKGDVKSYRFLNHQDAFDEFKRIFRRNPDLVSSIRPQDLPESFRVVPKRAELTDTVKKEFETVQGVGEVTTPGEALKGLIDVTHTVQYIFYGISIILLASSMFLIVNTIRLATFARRREIEVMKLVGASNWFVRIPFIAEGMVQGIVGAGLAIIAVAALKHFGFDQAFSDPSSFFSEFFVTTGDATFIALLVLLIGLVIGVIGATIGLRRFLRT